MSGKIKDEVVRQLLISYIDRSNVGLSKYGTTLEDNNGSLYEWLNHLQEELMDASLYIQKLKNKIEELNKLELDICEKDG
jgi:hypothetical protein